MDHPDVVSRLAILDGVPIVEALTAAMLTLLRHGGIGSSSPNRGNLSAPSSLPDVWYAGSPQQMGSEAYADFRAAIHDPATVHGMLEDYRGRLGIDRQHYEDDRRHGRRIRCPTLVLRSLRDDLERLYGDVMEVWKPGRQAGAEGVSIAATTWPRKRRTN